MTAEKLPKAYGECQISRINKIIFRGKTKVTWQRHTITILCSMDRELAGLPPLNPEEYGIRQRHRMLDLVDDLGVEGSGKFVQKLEESGDMEQLLRCMEMLNTDDRAAVLRYMADLDKKETATLLGRLTRLDSVQGSMELRRKGEVVFLSTAIFSLLLYSIQDFSLYFQRGWILFREKLLNPVLELQELFVLRSMEELNTDDRVAVERSMKELNTDDRITVERSMMRLDPDDRSAVWSSMGEARLLSTAFLILLLYSIQHILFFPAELNTEGRAAVLRSMVELNKGDRVAVLRTMGEAGFLSTAPSVSSCTRFKILSLFPAEMNKGDRVAVLRCMGDHDLTGACNLFGFFEMIGLHRTKGLFQSLEQLSEYKHLQLMGQIAGLNVKRPQKNSIPETLERYDRRNPWCNCTILYVPILGFSFKRCDEVEAFVDIPQRLPAMQMICSAFPLLNLILISSNDPV
ncbi:unnamed protein product [Darwinula stevensoni]|uniref:Uncharacterized protein n=1 Tax=Darwinula stevensoni TaxID=69355 RepID=A0A7R8X3G1_9CRUS|nr:unnamed protein product [Darwinula stevensoni]CAG0882331.1 unnamed protein product [Darwinula stevensoni]